MKAPSRKAAPGPAEAPVYPLAALVGQRAMVEALLLLAVDPSLGGLLLVGEKGTAKSTAARALAELLPPGESGERPPFRTVPLGVTEDRLLGGLDWEESLKDGRPRLKPGLLGEADGGLLYIDEVNLLEPSLAHLMLDAVAAGRVFLEREGLSASCPARVSLLATMNPEEGQLGPQLADRFALSVTLAGEPDPAQRAEVVRRRLAFERDPLAFRRRFAEAARGLSRRIALSRGLLPELQLTPAASALVAELAAYGRLAGHRGDLALAKAARALAAWRGQSLVDEALVEAVAGLALPQRERPAPARRLARVKIEKPESAPERDREFEPLYIAESPEEPPEPQAGPAEPDREPVLTLFKSASEFNLVSPKSKNELGPRDKSGRRQARENLEARGRAFRTTARRLGRPLSLAATLRAAAPHQARREKTPGRALALTPADLREKVYRRKTGRLVVFVVDSSGSIGTLYRMEEAKAAALALLADAYRGRDRVALIAFYGQSAELLLPPTNSPDLAGRLLAELPSGGKTPLAAALVMTRKLLSVEQAKDPDLTPHVVLMTDGRPNIPLDASRNPWNEALDLAGRLAEDPRLRILLIDTDRGAYNDYKLTRDLAERLRAPRLNLEDIRQGRLERWLKADCRA